MLEPSRSEEFVRNAKTQYPLDGTPPHDLFSEFFAVRESYLAAFHAQAGMCADTFAGDGPNERMGEEWRELYVAMRDETVKKACYKVIDGSYPEEITDYAYAFIELLENNDATEFMMAMGEHVCRPHAMSMIALGEMSAVLLSCASKDARTEFASLILNTLTDEEEMFKVGGRKKTSVS